MFNIKRFPIMDKKLSQWIKFIWHLEVEDGRVCHKLLPMDSIDLLINLGDEIVYETASDIMIAPRIHINGIRRQCCTIYQSGKINVWGISFNSFGLYPFIRCSLNDLNNIVDLRQLSLPLAEKLNAVNFAVSEEAIIQKILEVLLVSLHISSQDLEKCGWIMRFIQLSDRTSVRSYCTDNGINVRTFERKVLKMTGFSPIELCRIRRYKAASRQLLFNSSALISDIAYVYQYADQSHFSKEFKNLSGLSPKMFCREKSTVIENTNYY